MAVHPRLSLTGVKADEWIPIRPGTYGALALGIANVIINTQLYDADFVRDFTFGFEDFVDAEGVQHQGFKSLVLETYTLERVSSITGISTDKIARIAGEFATNRPAVAVLPTEPGELSSGNALYTALAVHALNALVGSIDVKGGVIIQRFPELADWPDFTLDSIALEGEARAARDWIHPIALALAFQCDGIKGEIRPIRQFRETLDDDPLLISMDRTNAFKAWTASAVCDNRPLEGSAWFSR